MLQTQMQVLAELPSQRRQQVMMTMDQLMLGGSRANGIIDRLYTPPPRGLPKLPMATFRQFIEAALLRTLRDTGTPRWKLLLVGYGWHFFIGATFGITYTLLFGQGSWALAFGWGAFIWLVMILMPPMMPIIRFPRWFPIWPFLAHMAMAAPLGIMTLRFVTDVADGASLLGAF